MFIYLIKHIIFVEVVRVVNGAEYSDHLAADPPPRLTQPTAGVHRGRRRPTLP